MSAFTRTGAGLLVAGLSVAGLLPMATATASPLHRPVVAKSTTSSWFADPLSHAARAKLIAVPAVPSRYDGRARRWTRALWTTHSGHLAVPADRAVGHQLAKGQAVTLEAPFASGKAVLPSTLRTQVALLRDSLADATSLRCEGYSGYSTGRPAHTSRLSRNRAAAVCHALVAALPSARTGHHRTPAVTTTARGYGGSRPVVVGGKRSRALTVRAANRRVVVVVTGVSDSSSTPTGPTTSPLPGAPTVSSVQSDDHSVTFDFTAPTTPGASAVTGYEYSTDGWSWHPLVYTGSAPYTGSVTGLTRATTYLVAVRAVNALGSGASSNEVLATTAPSPAGAPLLESAWLQGQGQWVTPYFSATMEVPTDDGGSRITAYQYRIADGDWTDLTFVTAPAFGRFSVGQSMSSAAAACGYPVTVTVRAVTAAGPGAASEPYISTVDCNGI